MSTYLKISGATIGSSKNTRHMHDIILDGFGPAYARRSTGVQIVDRAQSVWKDVWLSVDILKERAAALFLMDFAVNGGALNRATITKEILNDKGLVQNSWIITMNRAVVTSFEFQKQTAEMTFYSENVKYVSK